jgi:hypothetical protein
MSLTRDTGRSGPLRNGNPRGDPNLAARCGARTRAGCACRAPAMRGKARCRMHGGASTGPRTAEGLARLRAARTIHGRYGAEAVAFRRHCVVLRRRVRVLLGVVRCETRLPLALAARLRTMPVELLPPAIGAAVDPHQEAIALAPWRDAVAAARRRRVPRRLSLPAAEPLHRETARRASAPARPGGLRWRLQAGTSFDGRAALVAEAGGWGIVVQAINADSRRNEVHGEKTLCNVSDRAERGSGAAANCLAWPSSGLARKSG